MQNYHPPPVIIYEQSLSAQSFNFNEIILAHLQFYVESDLLKNIRFSQFQILMLCKCMVLS